MAVVPVVKVLLVATAWILVGAVSVAATIGIVVVLGVGPPLAFAVAVAVPFLTGVALARVSMRLLTGRVAGTGRAQRVALLTVGGIVAVVSVYALARGLGATEWSINGDSCITRSDQPQASHVRWRWSSSPPWGVVCTYEMANGQTVTLPQWYPERALPWVGVGIGVVVAYLLLLVTADRKVQIRPVSG